MEPQFLVQRRKEAKLLSAGVAYFDEEHTIVVK